MRAHGPALCVAGAGDGLIIVRPAAEPALFLVVLVLAFNFVGDGLRDAADPYT